MTKQRFSNEFKSRATDLSGFARDVTNFLSTFVVDVRNLMAKGVNVADNINAEIQSVTFQPNRPLTLRTDVVSVQGALIISTAGGVGVLSQGTKVSGSSVIISAVFDTTSPVNAVVYIFGN